MRKIFFLILILGLIASVLGCVAKDGNDKGSFKTDNLTVQKIYQLPKDKIKDQYSIEDFKDFYVGYLRLNSIAENTSSEDDKTGLSKEDQLKYYTIFDITPENIKKEIGCQIFKVNYTCETYVIHNGEFFTIGFGFGGMGVVTVTTCDFDEDGQKDLIYTFSWGSGLHRSHIGVFDLSEKREIWLDFIHLNEDIVLEKLTDNSFDVYASVLEMREDLNYTHYKIDLKRKVAEVTAKNRNVVVIPIQ